MLIHDELSTDNLLMLATQAQRDWFDAMRETKHEGRKLWSSSKSQAQRLEGYRMFEQMVPPPSGMSFDLACEIADHPEFETVSLTNNQEYGPSTHETDIYDFTGAVWTVAKRNWPEEVAFKTVVLTTEALPSLVAKRLGWSLTELDTPNLPRDPVEIRASRSVISKNLSSLVIEARNEFKQSTGRDLQAIGNKMGHVVNATTHHTAKGSNSFIGQDVVQTISPLPPAAFERLEVINAWAKISTAVRLWTMDQFNQTAGRNRGFRRVDGQPLPSHIVLINSRVWQSLGPVMPYARYKMVETVTRRTADQRKAKLHIAPTSNDQVRRISELLRKAA